MTQSVDTTVLYTSAAIFNTVRGVLAATLTTLGTELSAKAGMAGSDAGGSAWAAQYDPFATALVDQGNSAVLGAGQCADLLLVSGYNHAAAEAASTIGNTEAVELPPMASPTFAKPIIPSADGGHGVDPDWWYSIVAYVEGMTWPNGHQDQLRAAGDAWSAASTEFREAASLLNGGTSSLGAFAPLMELSTPELDKLLDNCTLVKDQINSAADGFDIAAQMCWDYAQNIDDAHSKIIDEMLMLGATIVVTELLAFVLIPITVGISEAVAKVVDVSRLVATGARIATLIREFRIAAELSGLPALAGSATAVRSLAQLEPLLAARPVLFAASASWRGRSTATGGPGHWGPSGEGFNGPARIYQEWITGDRSAMRIPSLGHAEML